MTPFSHVVPDTDRSVVRLSEPLTLTAETRDGSRGAPCWSAKETVTGYWTVNPAVMV